MPRVHNQEADAATEIAHQREMITQLRVGLLHIAEAIRQVEDPAENLDPAVHAYLKTRRDALLVERQRSETALANREERLAELLSRPKGGKGSVFTTRITYETRKALEDEAERTGRTIGDVAERWLERGRETSGQDAVPLTHPELAAVMRGLAAVSIGVLERYGLPTQSARARQVMIAAWTDAINDLMPYPPLAPVEKMAMSAHDAACFVLSEICMKVRNIRHQWPIFMSEWPGDDDALSMLRDALQDDREGNSQDLARKEFRSFVELEEAIYALDGRPSPLVSKVLGLAQVYRAKRTLDNFGNDMFEHHQELGKQVSREVLVPGSDGEMEVGPPV
jgi:hypothetical protein